MELIRDVFRPQHPGATIQHDRIRDSKSGSLHTDPSAPGELKASVAGEL